MGSDAETLDEIRNRVGSVLEQLLWQGADAHGFFDEWANHFNGMMASVASGLRDASQQLHKEAVQQREASDGHAAFNPFDPIGRVLYGVDGVMKNVNLTVLGEDLKPLGLSGERLKSVESLLDAGERSLPALGAVADIASFLVEDHANPKSTDTLNAGVNAVLSVGSAVFDGGAMLAAAGAVTIGGTAVAPVLGAVATGFFVAEGVNMVATTFDPKFDEQAVHVTKVAASFVTSGVRDALSLARHNPLNWAPML